jgi:hypothetical protein
VIVSLVRDCYISGCSTFRNRPIKPKADGNMTLSSSIQAIGRNSQDFLELEVENLRDPHLVVRRCDASFERLAVNAQSAKSDWSQE